MERRACWQIKEKTLRMNEIRVPSVKAEQIGKFDSTSSGSKFCCNCSSKDSKTRFTLSSSLFLAQEPNYLSRFPICICILVDSNSCRNVLKT